MVYKTSSPRSFRRFRQPDARVRLFVAWYTLHVYRQGYPLRVAEQHYPKRNANRPVRELPEGAL